MNAHRAMSIHTLRRAATPKGVAEGRRAYGGARPGTNLSRTFRRCAHGCSHSISDMNVRYHHQSYCGSRYSSWELSRILEISASYHTHSHTPLLVMIGVRSHNTADNNSRCTGVQQNSLVSVRCWPRNTRCQNEIQRHAQVGACLEDVTTLRWPSHLSRSHANFGVR